jgi:hypothetical protein
MSQYVCLNSDRCTVWGFPAMYIARCSVQYNETAFNFVRVLQAQISITRATEEERREVEDLVHGTPLEGRVNFERLDCEASLNSICEIHRAQADAYSVPGVNVAFCGNPKLAEDVRRSVLRIQRNPQFKDLTVVYSAETIFS